ncbi:hypothetical protein OG948_60505 (plasmid) [Embleya sp. NBC_00888]|uniref:hypothetical protein n=1 Tax=Embleya sp. NBC_00888 TaxID=2975960 RepID=UPI002F9132D2|nr:hypothetical protein OG948_60505 [Embleya sp. NBC_00888]
MPFRSTDLYVDATRYAGSATPTNRAWKRAIMDRWARVFDAIEERRPAVACDVADAVARDVLVAISQGAHDPRQLATRAVMVLELVPRRMRARGLSGRRPDKCARCGAPGPQRRA